LSRFRERWTTQNILNVSEFKQPIANLVRHGPFLTFLDVLKGAKFIGSQYIHQDAPFIKYAPGPDGLPLGLALVFSRVRFVRQRPTPQYSCLLYHKSAIVFSLMVDGSDCRGCWFWAEPTQFRASQRSDLQTELPD
jgi:hypothetical protein